VAGPGIKEVGGLLVTHGLVFTAVADGNSSIASASTGRPVLFPGGQNYYTGFTELAAAGDTLYVWLGSGCEQIPFTIQGQDRDIAAVDLFRLRVTAWAPELGTRNACISGLAAHRSQLLVAGPG
jgi:hypothetical protein